MYFQVPRREIHRTYDKIYATIYGQCIGDAIGLLTEGLKKDEVKKVQNRKHTLNISIEYFLGINPCLSLL